MKNNKEEILKKAIAKAVKNGWRELDTGIMHFESPYWYYPIIFSHSFAKAFWGKKKIRTIIDYSKGDGNKKVEYQISWEYYLQQLVLEKDPLKYIEKFL